PRLAQGQRARAGFLRRPGQPGRPPEARAGRGAREERPAAGSDRRPARVVPGGRAAVLLQEAVLPGDEPAPQPDARGDQRPADQGARDAARADGGSRMTMNCAEWEEKLNAELDGELPGDDRAPLDAHLAS